MLDLNIIPCISSEHIHIWNCHRQCQWCHKDRDSIELKASRLRIKELEDAIVRHKRSVLANYDEPDCSIAENLELWKQTAEVTSCS